MKNGLIYTGFKFLFKKLKYINLVELFKFVAIKFNPRQKLEYSRLGTDFFIIFKWILLILFWLTGLSNSFITFLVWYLILTNIYTYFYYHIWIDDALDTSNHDNDRLRRRFLNLLLALAFSDFSFAYLFRFPYKLNFIDQGSGNFLWYSISNSLAANYSVVQPSSTCGNSVSMIQLIFTFIFVAIIISRSIPQKN